MPAVSFIGRTLLAASFFCASGLLPAAQPADCRTDRVDATVRVSRVFDGDTVQLGDGRHLRLIAINTPERARDHRPAEPLAEAATERLRQLLATSPVLKLRYGSERQDRYGRLLAHAFLADGRNLTAILLREGRGLWITIPPNLWGLACYRRAERQARQARAGVWGHPGHRVRDAASLTVDDQGFQRVAGRVTRIGEGRRNLWLNLGEDFAVRIPHADLVYFKKIPPRRLAGRKIEVRGWVTRRKGQLRLTLRHPAGLKILD